jgi:NADH:ubiquinone oxidoreductase subunit F (NADH-binding)
VEAPVGLTLGKLIDTYGGGLLPARRFKMCQTGGASAGLVTAEHLDAPMEFGALAKVGGALGSGAMLVMDDSTCVVDFLLAVAGFFEPESCGQCTSCREGTPRLRQTITRICRGRGNAADLAFLERLAVTLMDASFCPLGQSAAVPLMSA